MGFWGDVGNAMIWPFGQEEEEDDGIKTMDPFDPKQREVFNQLSDFYKGKAGTGLPGWEGDFTAPLSEYEQIGMGKLGEYLESSEPEMTKFGLEQYQKGIEGLSPDQVYSNYMKYQDPMERHHLETSILPKIKEGTVKSGNIHGTSRWGGEGEARTQFGLGQLNRIGGRIDTERESARNMLRDLPAMTELSEGAPLRRTKAAMTYGALPRMLEQDELNKRIDEFKRTTPELNPILDKIHQYLNIGTKTAYQEQPQPDPMTEMMSAGMEMLPFLLMAMA